MKKNNKLLGIIIAVIVVVVIAIVAIVLINNNNNTNEQANQDEQSEEQSEEQEDEDALVEIKDEYKDKSPEELSQIKTSGPIYDGGDVKIMSSSVILSGTTPTLNLVFDDSGNTEDLEVTSSNVKLGFADDSTVKPADTTGVLPAGEPNVQLSFPFEKSGLKVGDWVYVYFNNGLIDVIQVAE